MRPKICKSSERGEHSYYGLRDFSWFFQEKDKMCSCPFFDFSRTDF